jgi:hypothetical protein
MAASVSFNIFSAPAEIVRLNRAQPMFGEAAGTFCPNRTAWQ